MKKVILNKCYGGFDVSIKATLAYAKKKHLKVSIYKRNFNNHSITYSLVSPKIVKDDGFLKYAVATKYHGRVANNLPPEDILDLDGKYREDATLIEVVEKLGKEANTIISDLRVVEIPDDLDYMIDNYDGIETLHQRVQEW